MSDQAPPRSPRAGAPRPGRAALGGGAVRAVRVHLTSWEKGPGTWQTSELKLRALHRYAENDYELCEEPERADVIVIGDFHLREQGWRTHGAALVRRFPAKCVAVSDQDGPVPFLHGLYASGERSLLACGRVRTGAYTLQEDTWINPFIRDHRPGAEVEGKRYLASFVGRISHPIRQRLLDLPLRRPDVLLEDSTRHFELWGGVTPEAKLAGQKRYHEILTASKFALCPRGCGASSMRLFEAMRVGVAPVIVSDPWILPRGPQWEQCSIRVGERQVGELERILEEREPEQASLGRAARAAYEAYFAEPVYFDYVVRNCRELLERQVVPERLYWMTRRLLVAWIAARVRARSMLRRLARR